MIEQFTIGTADIENNRASVVLTQLSRLDGAIEKEFTLVSDRMTWMMISESFIFGTFTAAVVHFNPTHPLRYAVLSLLAMLPFLGISIAVLAFRAINAAHTAADRLKDRREQLEKVFSGQLNVELVSSKLDTHAVGNLPPKYLPPIMIATWIILLSVVVIQITLSQNSIPLIVIGLIILLYVGALFILNRTYVTQIHNLESRLRMLEKNLLP
jgi:hypothetical protein